MEVVKLRPIFEDFANIMKNQLAFLDAIKAGKEFNPTDAAATEDTGNIECYQRVAVHG